MYELALNVYTTSQNLLNLARQVKKIVDILESFDRRIKALETK